VKVPGPTGGGSGSLEPGHHNSQAATKPKVNEERRS